MGGRDVGFWNGVRDRCIRGFRRGRDCVIGWMDRSEVGGGVEGRFGRFLWIVSRRYLEGHDGGGIDLVILYAIVGSIVMGRLVDEQIEALWLKRVRFGGMSSLNLGGGPEFTRCRSSHSLSFIFVSFFVFIAVSFFKISAFSIASFIHSKIF